MSEIVVGRILKDNKYIGTGFLVAPDYFITAKHNIVDADEIIEINSEKGIEIWFEGYGNICGKTINLIEAIDKGIDCVFIELEEMVDISEINKLSKIKSKMIDFKCKIVGYPKLADGKMQFTGTIVTLNDMNMTICIDKTDRLQNYEGVSGSPVIVNGYIIGIVTRQLGTEIIEALSVNIVDKILGLAPINKIDSEFSINHEYNSYDISIFQGNVAKAIRIAGPRYSKNLNLKTELYRSLEYHLNKDSIKNQIKHVVNKIQDIIEKIESFIKYSSSNEWGILVEDRKIIEDIIEVLGRDIEEIKECSLGKLQNKMQIIKEDIVSCKELSEKVFANEKERFEQKNGLGTYNNKSWRGFMASYMCSFPTQYLDELREAIQILVDTYKVINIELIRTINNNAILITGKGGIGKTHLLCDVVQSYIEKDFPAILLFGEMFNGNNVPEIVIMESLGINDRFDNLLYWLNDVGRKNNIYIPICIDAINETQDNMYWNNNISALIASIESYQNIKLILSCRSIYLEEYLYDEKVKNMLQMTHDGFTKIEVEALSTFCEYYGVNINYETTIIPGFMNPLFLKMLCEIAAEKENKTVVIEDIKSLMDSFFELKNKKISIHYPDYFSIRDNVVTNILNNVSKFMTCRNQYYICWANLREIVAKALKEYNAEGKTAAIIKELISENLLREADIDNSHISFGYEKFYEYIYSKKFIENGINTIVDFVKEKKITLGALEIIQIEFFKRNKVELLSLLDGEIHGEAVDSFLSGLYWRKDSEIDENTLLEVEKLLHSGNEADIRRTVISLLAIATKPNCILNANYIHQKLSLMNNYKRDYFLSCFLTKQYDQIKVLSDLCDRAIELGKASFSKASIYLWKLSLCWCCSSNDIKLRDRASKGLANLIRIYPDDAIKLIKKFDMVNDDYIQERLWQAIYSAIITINKKEVVLPLAQYILDEYAGTEKWPQNVLIRDFLRNIVEFSCYKTWIDSEKLKNVRPPYRSMKHELNIEWVNSNKNRDERLFWNCQDSDFAIYSIPYEVEDYGISRKDVGLMIFEDIIKSGYTEGNIYPKYDSYIDYKYGSLRNRDADVERIGKKYQQIFLYREMGNIYDNYEYKPRYKYDDIQVVQEEQGNSFRSIDLSIFKKNNDFTGKKLMYPFTRYKKFEDMRWFEKEDIDEYAIRLLECEYSGEDYYILQGYFSDREQTKSFREMWIQIRAYLFTKDYKIELLNWIKDKDFDGRWMPEGLGQLYECCVGEYPWSPTMINYLSNEEEQDFRQENTAPCYLYTTANDYTAEKDSAFCTENYPISYMFPSKFLFEGMNLSWDGGFGYLSDEEMVICNGINNTLYIKKSFLNKFMDENNLDIVWTILGEKEKITGGFGREYPGRSSFSYSFFLDEQHDFFKNHYIFHIEKPRQGY